MTMNRDTELRALVKEMRDEASHSDEKDASALNAWADRIEALLARTEAGADREDTHEYTLSGVLSYGAIAIKPEQGAVPSHLRNLLRQALGYLKIELEGRHAAPVEDGAVAWMTADGKLCTAREKRDCLVQDASTYTIPLTHPHDASARLSEVERKSVTDLMESQVYEAGDVDDEPPSIDENEDAYWAYHNYHGLRKLLAALPSPPKEKES